MKILSVSLENFASYKRLDFQFDEQGLALIHGPTGAGKSTLCDAIPWCFFGITAKGGKVDEVLSWPGNSVTSGTIYLDGGVSITRIRGPKAKDNDLYFQASGLPTRGKDIPDTQRRINDLLGMDAYLYLSGAYYHEFSKTASFFTTTAKARRELSEQLVDLSLAKTLQNKAGEAKKVADIQLQKTLHTIEMTANRIELLEHRLIALKRQSEHYITEREERLAKLMAKYANFEQEKADRIAQEQGHLASLILQIVPRDKLEASRLVLKAQIADFGQDKCVTCGAPHRSEEKAALVDRLHTLEQTIIKNEGMLVRQKNCEYQLKAIKAQVNAYDDQLLELDEEKNPYVRDFEDTARTIAEQKQALSLSETTKIDLMTQADDYKQLTEVLNDFRAVLIKSTIVDLQNQTNSLMAKHFDAEIRVEFTTGDADKVDVLITKDGNQAVYSQLSKGQRQLLRLAFGVSVMRTVANKHGLRFNVAMMDEAFDGLSEEFKVQAYGLLQELSMEYDSLFIVEHSSELKALFEKQFVVSLTADGSVIDEA